MAVRVLAGCVVVLLAAGVAPATAAAGPRDPKRELRPAEQALAKRIVLRASDLPGSGWHASRSSPSSSGFSCPGFEPDMSDLTEYGHASSPDFDRPDAYVSSNAGVFSTAAQGRTAYGRVARPGLADCLSRVFAQGIGGQAKVAIVAKGRLAFPGLGDRSSAYRLVVRVTSGKQTVGAWLDVVLLNRARVDVAMIFVGIGRPFAAADEQRLARTVTGRIP